jgi:hypothetical protein
MWDDYIVHLTTTVCVFSFVAFTLVRNFSKGLLIRKDESFPLTNTKNEHRITPEKTIGYQR